MEHIYILRLKEGKYYIGKTKNVDKRWNEHITGDGSGWTKKYKPISLIKTIISTSYFDEDKYVKEYMAKYGIDNVRGGTYSNIDLDDNTISVLEKEIRHSKNLCTRCGRNTHFIKDCYAKTDNNGNIIEVAKKAEPVIHKDKKSHVYKAKAKHDEMSSSSSSSSENYDDSCSDDDDSWKGKKNKVFINRSVKPCDICGIKGHREVNCYNF
jgi:predicted GIY-YIG superfamily endonuclease